MPQQQPEDTPDGVDGEPKFTHAMASTSLSSSDRGTFPLEEFAKRNFQVTGRGTDLAIRCRGKIFHVHSDLLCAKSEFIKKACDPNSPFKKTSEFDFDEEEPLTVWLMLRNCYHCEDWGPLEEEPEGGWSFMALKERLRRSVLAYTIADKYQFLDSKQSEFQVFADLVSTRFDVLRRHETRNHLWNPRNDDFVSEIVWFVAFVFETTPYTDKQLRRLILFHLSEHISTLMMRNFFGKGLARSRVFGRSLRTSPTTRPGFDLACALHVGTWSVKT
ncbi:hypothetical protein IWX90DRAFT_481465 [Phyllosticta citrichinensis]|uniref:BTB domain-containing protein n=1 Tax=Phyllosticta citrichinensis TaxID=1130410 RepID=A0ABR1XFT1_9PEZI